MFCVSQKQIVVKPLPDYGAQLMEYSVYIILWLLRFKPESDKCLREIGDAKKIINRWCHPATYGSQTIGLVVVTDESALELAKRIQEATQDMMSVQEVQVIGAPEPNNIASTFSGTFGPLNHWVRAGWVEARERNKTKNVRRQQRR